MGPALPHGRGRLRRIAAHLQPHGPRPRPSAAQAQPHRARTTADLGITPTTDRDEALSQLQREGFCVLEDVMGADALPALREELVRHMQDPER